MEWFKIVALVLLGLMTIAAAVWVLKNEKSRIQEWLLAAVADSEKQLGSGTGQLKLRQVYNWFIDKFPIVSMFVHFETFSDWVDLALKELKRLIETNPSVKAIVEKGE